MTQTEEQLRTLKYYTLFSFFVIGVVTVLLGQMLPILSQRLSLNDAQAGTLFLAQFTGSMCGTLVSSVLTRRFGFVWTILLGLLILIAGLPGVNSNEFAVCWIAIFVYGSGLGITIPSVNLLTIEVTAPERQSSAVNLINFCWGLGAICSQPFVAFVSHGQSLVAVTLVLEIALFVLAILFFSFARKLVGRRSEQSDEPIQRIWRKPAAWLFLLFGFCMIGIEGGLGGWLTTYSADLEAKGIQTINATVIFFSFFVLGRGLASIVSRRMSENLLISFASTILLIGILIIVVSEDLAVLGAAISGFGASAIFPTNMVRFTRVFGPQAIRQATPLFISGILGAASLSWLTGVVSTTSGSLRLGIVVMLVSATFVVILHAAITLKFREATLKHGSA